MTTFAVKSFDKERLAWAAGLFDGEGCFSLRQNVKGSKMIYPRATLSQNHDDELVWNFRTAIGFGKVRKFRNTWTWDVYTYEHVQQVLCLLWKHLGEQKRQDGIYVLTECKKQYSHNHVRGEACTHLCREIV